MEDQPKNLGTLCRVCGKSFDEDDRVTKISTLKIHQKVKTELFGEDEIILAHFKKMVIKVARFQSAAKQV